MNVQILDGAIGTELGERGFSLDAPRWSAQVIEDAPDILAEVHAAYAQAGATLHTANTFRTQPRAFGEGWLAALDAAVRIAREAAGPGNVLLGSMAPVMDCYRPDLSPGEAARQEHRSVATALTRSGVDVLLCETFAHGPEALVAVEEATATGLPVWLSLSAGPFAELLTAAELATIGRDAASIGVRRLLVNCVAASQIGAYVDALAALSVPIGVYANAGREDEGLGWGGAGSKAAEAYADLAERWIDSGASVIGGCCGTGPRHIRALAERFG
ncbi:MAG: homocysteine S-methyltransferase family protein [Polyangiales bacterium]